MDENELQAQVVERYLTAQRAFLMALKLVFEGEDSEFTVVSRSDSFNRSWGEALFCNGAIAEVLDLTPQTINEIQDNVDNGIILDEQATLVGGLDGLEKMYGDTANAESIP